MNFFRFLLLLIMKWFSISLDYFESNELIRRITEFQILSSTTKILENDDGMNIIENNNKNVPK